MIGWDSVKLKNVSIWVLAFLVFALRYWLALPAKNDSGNVGFYLGQRVEIEAVVAESPDIEDAVGIFYLDVRKIKLFGSWREIVGKIAIKTVMVQMPEIGDILILSGILEEYFIPDPRIRGFIKSPSVEVVNRSAYNVFGALHRLKLVLIERLNGVFPEPSSSLAAGILLGSRSAIPADNKQDFKTCGLTHILAISGYNIVIVISFISAICAFLPRKYSVTLSILMVAVFTLLVGASASVVRAAFMGSLSLVAKFFGRPYSGLRALFITGFAMALLDPFIIFYDIGFQLSFAATAGMILFSKRINEKLKFVPEKFSLRENLASTWSAQVFALPIIFFQFKNFSAISTFANLVVLPFIPILMVGSFLGLIFGKIFAGPTWILFEAVIYIIHLLAGIPGASFNF